MWDFITGVKAKVFIRFVVSKRKQPTKKVFLCEILRSVHEAQISDVFNINN